MLRINFYKSIKFKITLTFAGVFAVLGLLLNYYNYQNIRYQIIAKDNSYLLARAGALLDKTNIAPIVIPIPDEGEHIRIIYRHLNQKKTLYQSDSLKNISVFPNKKGVIDTLNLRIATQVKTLENSDDKLQLTIFTTDKALVQSLQLIFLSLIITTFIVILVAAPIAYILSKIILKPINKIIHTTQKINSAKLTERIAIPESNDEVAFLASTINDMLQRLDNAVTLQNGFFASASHELRTPLAILKGELEISLKQEKYPPEIQNLLKSQLGEVSRLQRIVQEFLLISQLKADKVQLYLQNNDIQDSILKSIIKLKSFLNDEHLKVNFMIDEKLQNSEVNLDEEKIALIWVNLIENASKYAITKHLQITVTEELETINVIFENDTTLAKPDIKLLKTAFHQADLLKTGAGVGLWLCEQLIIQHGGSMQIKVFENKFSVIIKLPKSRQV